MAINRSCNFPITSPPNACAMRASVGVRHFTKPDVCGVTIGQVHFHFAFQRVEASLCRDYRLLQRTLDRRMVRIGPLDMRPLLPRGKLVSVRAAKYRQKGRSSTP